VSSNGFSRRPASVQSHGLTEPHRSETTLRRGFETMNAAHRSLSPDNPVEPPVSRYIGRRENAVATHNTCG
jgi:hypothetical protein